MDTAGGGRKVETKPHPTSWKELGTLVAVWYGCNVFYGMTTKTLLTELYYPWTVATIQMLFGVLCQLPLWYLGRRKIPNLKSDDIKSLLPLSICQFGIHAGATYATGIHKGLAVSHIIKALEPICTMGVEYILSKQVIPVALFLGIVPLVAGSILPFLKYATFDFGSMVATLIVVMCSATRVVLCRNVLQDNNPGKNLDASNLFVVLSIMASAIFVPLALCLDGFGFFGALGDKLQTTGVANVFGTLCMSGFLYYMFNVASFDLTTKVTPVTHAIVNLMRRPAVVFLFAFFDVIHEILRMIPLNWVPFSFLFWSKAVRSTHNAADPCRKFLAVIATYTVAPSVDSITGSFLALLGCLVYAKEMNGDLGTTPSSKKSAVGKRKSRRSFGVAQ